MLAIPEPEKYQKPGIIRDMLVHLDTCWAGGSRTSLQQFWMALLQQACTSLALYQRLAAKRAQGFFAGWKDLQKIPSTSCTLRAVASWFRGWDRRKHTCLHLRDTVLGRRDAQESFPVFLCAFPSHLLWRLHHLDSPGTSHFLP